MNSLDEKLEKIIKQKYIDLRLGLGYKKRFSKIRAFEANAVGQIGEEFIKYVISDICKIHDDGVIHNEYDIKTVGGILFEIKTARKGRSNNTFQSNGINPNYNYNYLILLGISEDVFCYRIFKKQSISYKHENRKFYLEQDNLKKQLVQMNPQNQVNYKLTLNIKDMKKSHLLKE